MADASEPAPSAPVATSADGAIESPQASPPTLVTPSFTFPEAKEICVSNTMAGFDSLVAPATALIAKSKSEQQSLLTSVKQAKERLANIEEQLAILDPTFSKLPLYIAKLELMGKNMKTLCDNAAKTKTLAHKLQEEVDRLVS